MSRTRVVTRKTRLCRKCKGTPVVLSWFVLGKNGSATKRAMALCDRCGNSGPTRDGNRAMSEARAAWNEYQKA